MVCQVDGYLPFDPLSQFSEAVLECVLWLVPENFAGKGDIGDHYPDDDPSFENAESIGLLGRMVEALAGWSVVNVDVTVIAERPRLGPHKQRMAERLADAMQVQAACVNVKATTSEGMGFVGRGEGIAALAVAQIRQDA